MPKTEQSIREWCKTCVFEKTEDGKYFQVRKGEMPSFSECLQCLYTMVQEMKVTKPPRWRLNRERT